MRVLSGTSGYSYDEWRGIFYPPDQKKDGMLAYYAGELPAVEINNTFYRMPDARLLEKWRDETPAAFRFALKASRRITHLSRLKGCEEAVAYWFRTAAVLGEKLGPTLFQLPPNMKRDVPLLEAFLSLLPEGHPAAFEFRHPTWFDEAVYAALARSGAALVGGDVDDADRSPPLVPTARFGYLRLRCLEYAPGELEGWRATIHAQPWEEAYVFFKHETEGPARARLLLPP
jgi:uncharacterized protein YecE (DUF72 family)